mmetsp:Transcript_7240/g.23899  ORF Transcript_7240/g.23899 Transcript_7240/m.23899 type:complete len:330 (+) Transcript_7240:128-1117(+)
MWREGGRASRRARASHSRTCGSCLAEPWYRRSSALAWSRACSTAAGAMPRLVAPGCSARHSFRRCSSSSSSTRGCTRAATSHAPPVPAGTTASASVSSRRVERGTCRLSCSSQVCSARASEEGEEEEEEGGRCHRHCSGTPVLVRSNSSTSCCSWRPVALAASSEGATSRTSASQTAKARQKCARARGGPWPSFQLRMSRRRVAISASLRCCRAASAPVEPCASPLTARSSVGSRSEAISPARWCSIEWYFSSLCDERATCASRASSCSASVSTASASSAGATKERASARRRVEARPQRSLTARQPDSGGVAAARWPERETQSAASSAR